jgi:farnesyl diphosphate synthase
VPLGEYFQIQDDYLDYTDTLGQIGKIGHAGPDIMDNKCSWMRTQPSGRCWSWSWLSLDALSYGGKNSEAEARVKQVLGFTT